MTMWQAKIRTNAGTWRAITGPTSKAQAQHVAKMSRQRGNKVRVVATSGVAGKSAKPNRASRKRKR